PGNPMIEVLTNAEVTAHMPASQALKEGLIDRHETTYRAMDNEERSHYVTYDEGVRSGFIKPKEETERTYQIEIPPAAVGAFGNQRVFEGTLTEVMPIITRLNEWYKANDPTAVRNLMDLKQFGFTDEELAAIYLQY